MSSQWSTVSDVPNLTPGIVHIWLLHIDDSIIPLVHDTLSGPELERAAAFRFPIHRNEFVIARGALRFLLGKYLDTHPASVDIRTSDKAKPFVSHEHTSGVQFNLSHSGSFAVFGLALTEALGVDIERHNPSFVDDGMLRQCLMSDEISRYTREPQDGKVPFFFDTWARKEAYMKLVGDGLNIPPNEFSLSSSNTKCEMIRGEEIYFMDMPVIDGYSSALATKNKISGIEFYRLGSNLLA